MVQRKKKKTIDRIIKVRVATHGILHAGFRGFRAFVAREKCRFKLIRNCPELLLRERKVIR